MKQVKDEGNSNADISKHFPSQVRPNGLRDFGSKDHYKTLLSIINSLSALWASIDGL